MARVRRRGRMGQRYRLLTIFAVVDDATPSLPHVHD
ncbi:hypothetical protein PPSIR1_41659 [Plesiocystis pacifica SIR-1]|uniref:Uncharacterized protein n=1 Tax=Plesiocystis pacifica SIR-1 TaxID=391625 RepID=A6G0S3_9BACT|nr:hypothetical protein PPSIR1_41659 [Plesiocystis pacifica SIR-1]